MRAIIALVVLAIPSVVVAGQLPDEPHIYVEGQHTETVEADRFSVRVSISEVAPKSSAAAAAVAKKLAVLLERVRAVGVPESDIRAFEIVVEPEHEWVGGKRSFVGTRVTRQLEFSHDEIATMRKLLDAVIEADVAEVHDARVSSSQEPALREKALQQAVVDARQRAERIAASLGSRLGEVYSVSEFQQHYPPTQLREFDGYAAADISRLRAESPVGPFTPGPIEISSRVYVVFLLAK